MYKRQGGVYSVNSTEMMSGLGIISEHIQFANFVTSIGMAAFAPFLYQLVCVRREKMMCIVEMCIRDRNWGDPDFIGT